ncbi:hypothetical protein TrRE_jg10422 [Triparma retinervis]|uniref:Uncharacterized protein n=1 Tax=Triparma retinervis TaxID=2557542 RepID=A0A9W7AUS2_9STRA|nr:hypothetical protein TrRE_jg10422 [Triparma retinervis]
MKESPSVGDMDSLLSSSLTLPQLVKARDNPPVRDDPMLAKKKRMAKAAKKEEDQMAALADSIMSPSTLDALSVSKSHIKGSKEYQSVNDLLSEVSYPPSGLLPPPF